MRSATLRRMTSLTARLDRIADAIPRAFPGPGGAIAALRNGEVVLRHTWGWANAERRIPFTPRSLFRMCSITKQFTCAVVLDAFPDPSALDADVRARLPLLEQPAPRALHLCHNQSGLRDYWAVAMLHGSPAEAPFGDTEAARIIAGTKPACGHHDRVEMPAACCPTVMAGHVPAIRSESLSGLVAGTCPAMTIGRMSVHRDFRRRCRKAMNANHADEAVRRPGIQQ